MSGLNVAVVAGASGMVGRYLLEVLGEDSFYDRVILLSRRPVGRSGGKFEERIVDFESLSPADLAGGTHLFCSLGTTMKKAGSREAFRKVDYDACLAFAKQGKAAGARRLMLVSSTGASAKSTSFYTRVKGELEEAVKPLGFESLQIFRPSLLLGKRDEHRAGEHLAEKLLRGVEWMMQGGLRKYRPMPAGVLAASMAAAGERAPAGTHVLYYDDIYRMAGF